MWIKQRLQPSERWRSTRKPFQLLSSCWVSPQGGQTLPNPQHTVLLSLSLCVYIHLSSPLLAHSEARTEGEILKNKSDARQCVFPRWFIQFEKISEKQWVQVLRESVQWQHFFPAWWQNKREAKMTGQLITEGEQKKMKIHSLHDIAVTKGPCVENPLPNLFSVKKFQPFNLVLCYIVTLSWNIVFNLFVKYFSLNQHFFFLFGFVWL